ncbi:UNVERIFIED_ORG: hypothetical protein M2193_000219 [Bradyrhizobium japonicum]|uniref:Uncharacterized protein n=1 Tax=Bradyrhizobium diazoefficiens TaxID=1355477 RepID=A0A810CXU8_9BRAD|nr:hypothetical protein XF1B_49010 [Bradyrhizobium diazoefficiens]BCE48485.1 hypothetical protein XF4B_48340 [Bradyrhizobium diazoefficiens]BCE92001.1 hypothetical protein XF10B_47990 [Bradyrhizobium diazoefficiens]BCF26929.1 hypothetical protein XF14B_48810 [Bradyrhizobium diazoefficiens]
MPMSASTHDILVRQGYKLVEDDWDKQGRRTYLNDENADRAFLGVLERSLRSAGWTLDRAKLRSFVRPEGGEVIEIEPGGAETSGHFLHHMKALD